VGYSRTRDGAAAALVNYSVVLSGMVFKPEAQRAAALRVMGTSGFAADAAARLRRARTAAASTPIGRGLRHGARTVYRGAPIGYRVVRYSQDEAVIETWAFGVVANDAGLGPQMSFQTSTSTLRWTQGDWKLAASTSVTGPSPAVSGSPGSSAGFVALLSRLQGLRYAP